MVAGLKDKSYCECDECDTALNLFSGYESYFTDDPNLTKDFWTETLNAYACLFFKCKEANEILNTLTTCLSKDIEERK